MDDMKRLICLYTDEEFAVNALVNSQRQEQQGFTMEDIGDDYAGVYISNVNSGCDAISIRIMMSIYGIIVRIIAFRLMPNSWSYLIIYTSEDDAQRATNSVKACRPLLAINFGFYFVPHLELVNHRNILSKPNEKVEVTDYN